MASFTVDEQRVIIKFLTMKGRAPVDIHGELLEVCAEHVLDISSVRRWAKQFKNGRESCADQQRSGRHPHLRQIKPMLLMMIF